MYPAVCSAVMAGIAYLRPIRWSRAASTPSRSVLLRVGWPMSRRRAGWRRPSRVGQDPYGLQLGVGQQVRLVDYSSGTRPRSPRSAAISDAAWAASSAEPWAGRLPSAVTTSWWMPRVPVVGSGR